MGVDDILKHAQVGRDLFDVVFHCGEDFFDGESLFNHTAMETTDIPR